MKRILWLLAIAGIVILVVYLNLQRKINVSPPNNVDFHDVKYYFDSFTFESVTAEMPDYKGGNDTATRNEIIRGKVIKTDIPLYCIKAPCAPEKGFALADINQSQYNLKDYKVIMAFSGLINEELINKTCIIRGNLMVGVYSVNKSILISRFEPQEIIYCE